MGICQQKSQSTIKSSSKSLKTVPRQSFLYNSFTYDPSHIEQLSSFFYFDLPHYCQIQYILRKSDLGKAKQSSNQMDQISKQDDKTNEQFIANLQKHIAQIQQAIAKFRDEDYMKNHIEVSMNEKNMLKQQKSKQIEKMQTKQFTQQNQESDKFNNTLNFELVSANLNLGQYEVIECLNFQLTLNNTKIMTIQGTTNQNKWKPNSTNQISLNDIKLNLKSDKIEPDTELKLSSVLDGNEQIQCTIPCNSLTFKYIIPVLQTANIRSKADKQPMGHVHFRIEYISDFRQHQKQVIADLTARKKALQDIIQQAKNSNFKALQDKSLVMEEPESFLSDIREN